MSNKPNTKTKATMDPFQEWCHKWGRLGTVLALVYMIIMPIVVLTVHDSMPQIGQVLNIGTLGMLAIYIPVGISEALSYTPIMGSSAYLGFITGNIMNMKLPVAVNAIKISGKQQNTAEGDAVASIGIAVCSIMTIAIITLAALLGNLIAPIFELQAIKTASGYLVPALFGSMALGLFASTGNGKKVVKNGIMGVVPTLIIVSLLCLVVRITTGGSLGGMEGLLILVMLPVTLISSRIMWKKGIIKVVANTQENK